MPAPSSRRGARVWVLSDGFDTDAPEQLAEALQAVRGRGARITWFHPTRLACPRPPRCRARASTSSASCRWRAWPTWPLPRPVLALR